MKNNQNSKVKPHSSKEKLKTQEKTSKLKEKTQNSRKKHKFLAYSYVGHEEKMAKK